MLVLTRKKGERVLIGDDIVITLIDIRGDGVRIGFDAPRGVKIQRAEVVKAVGEANAEAAASTAEAGDLLVGLLAARRSAAADSASSQPAVEADDEAAAEDAPQPAPASTPTVEGVESAAEPASAQSAPAPVPAQTAQTAQTAQIAPAEPGRRPKPAPRRPRS